MHSQKVRVFSQSLLIPVVLVLLSAAIYAVVLFMTDAIFLLHGDNNRMDPVPMENFDANATYPTSVNDYISVETSCGGMSTPIRVGDDIFGYPAPLESYIPIYRIKWGSEEKYIDRWLSLESDRAYYIPVRDLSGRLEMSFYAMRGYYGYSAWRNDEAFFAYLSARERLEGHFNRKSINVLDRRIVFDLGMNILVAETDAGVHGMIYLMDTHAALRLRNEGLRIGSVRGVILSEQELIEVLSAARKGWKN
jgi:heme-degrading monooxygenase HmoA